MNNFNNSKQIQKTSSEIRLYTNFLDILVPFFKTNYLNKNYETDKIISVYLYNDIELNETQINYIKGFINIEIDEFLNLYNIYKEKNNISFEFGVDYLRKHLSNL